MEKEVNLVGVFKRRIDRARLAEYCEFYELDKDEQKTQLRTRGYHLLAL